MPGPIRISGRKVMTAILNDVLVVESEVSAEIVEALKANLSPGEAHVLAAASTHDPEAHDLFLRAEYEKRQAESTPTADALDRADAFYRQALAHDPNFVEAAAGLANSRLSRHWFVSPLAPRELEEVKSIIDHALALAPDSPEAHYALGMFFIGAIANTRMPWQSLSARLNYSLTTLRRDNFADGSIGAAANGNARSPMSNAPRNSTRGTLTFRPASEGAICFCAFGTMRNVPDCELLPSIRTKSRRRQSWP